MAQFGDDLSWQEPELLAYQTFLQNNLLNYHLTQTQLLAQLKRPTPNLQNDIFRAINRIPIEAVSPHVLRLLVKFCLQEQAFALLEPLLQKWGSLLPESEQALISALMLNAQSEVKAP